MFRKTSLKPRKKPRQARSSQLVDVILQAAARILEREGLTGYNSNRIAEVAGVSIGSFYQYFPNKEAVTAQLIRQSQEQLIEGVSAVLDQSGDEAFETAMARLLAVVTDYQLQRPALAAALDREEARLPVDEIIQESRARIMDRLVLFFQTRGLIPLQGTLHDVVADIITICRALCDATLDGPPVTREALLQRLSFAVMGYLGQATRR
ncbi:TetR/AcrR family transcriptional regulator [Aestuariispira insulae]|uniref:TetR family transcriptional regulator n=1 Tax=Aestuariispira insulae TaxID=1461337 RepID=A0A3D9HS39_9PROT|nr:TetR/AcrR family transcriptional regulator [Aestuariispira insulae]RED52318.1 TetR family transcriptional regulator [Aestuariispira insulae]